MDCWRVAPHLNCRSHRYLWVPRPSRIFRKVGTGLPTVNGLSSKGPNDFVRTYTVGSILPALAQNARTGHHSFEMGMKNLPLNGQATRPTPPDVRAIQ